MPYDLYGNYYKSALDAENAETAQCAAIDADIANRKVVELEKKIQQMSFPEMPVAHKIDGREKVKSITEAFSQQPITMYVGMIYDYDKQIKVSAINLEIINVPINGDPFDYRFYVGRDENGNKLFQFRAETVSVCFYCT